MKNNTRTASPSLLMAIIVAVVMLCVAAGLFIGIKMSNKPKNESFDKTAPEASVFYPETVLNDPDYVICVGDNKITELKYCDISVTYRYALRPAEEGSCEPMTVTSTLPGYVDKDGNAYVSPQRYPIYNSEELEKFYAIRILNDEEAAAMLNSEALLSASERDQYVLMHMLAQYSRKNVFNSESPIPRNSFVAIQSVLYFTDSRIVRLNMTQSAPLKMDSSQTPYGTSMKVYPIEENEWVEKPLYRYSLESLSQNIEELKLVYSYVYDF